MGLDQDRRARPQHQQGRALPVPRGGLHVHRDDLDRQAHGAEAEQRADRRRGRLRPHDPNITRRTMSSAIARKWFPFVATLFFFIWFSNMIGSLPLPTNSEETFN